MELLLPILLISLLAVLTVQDFKSRAISWFLIPLLFIGFIAYGLIEIELDELVLYFSINSYIVLSCLFGVTLIVSLRAKKLTNILKEHLGLGDVLFFLILTVAFSPINFLGFYIGSILMSCLIYGVIILSNKKETIPFPLAGGMSLMLIIALITSHYIPVFNFYQDVL